MFSLHSQVSKGDPSEVLQLFTRVHPELLCCRYWWLRHWEFRELAFPYWRIYMNNREGAFVRYDGQEYALKPGELLLISPNTGFSTRLFDAEIPENGFVMEGGKVDKQSLALLEQTDVVGHLFVHFKLGVLLDNVSPGIHVLKSNESRKAKCEKIIAKLIRENTVFDIRMSLILRSLIEEVLSELDETNWLYASTDRRIVLVLEYIENSLAKRLDTQTLSGLIGMAPNSFHRLFQNEIGMAPQKYVKQCRINEACILLHHSDKTIDQICSETGFSDRYHFSRVFKQVTSISPARYRKSFQ